MAALREEHQADPQGEGPAGLGSELDGDAKEDLDREQCAVDSLERTVLVIHGRTPGKPEGTHNGCNRANFCQEGIVFQHHLGEAVSLVNVECVVALED